MKTRLAYAITVMSLVAHVAHAETTTDTGAATSPTAPATTATPVTATPVAATPVTAPTTTTAAPVATVPTVNTTTSASTSTTTTVTALPADQVTTMKNQTTVLVTDIEKRMNANPPQAVSAPAKTFYDWYTTRKTAFDAKQRTDTTLAGKTMYDDPAFQRELQTKLAEWKTAVQKWKADHPTTAPHPIATAPVAQPVVAPRPGQRPTLPPVTLAPGQTEAAIGCNCDTEHAARLDAERKLADELNKNRQLQNQAGVQPTTTVVRTRHDSDDNSDNDSSSHGSYRRYTSNNPNQILSDLFNLSGNGQFGLGNQGLFSSPFGNQNQFGLGMNGRQLPGMYPAPGMLGNGQFPGQFGQGQFPGQFGQGQFPGQQYAGYRPPVMPWGNNGAGNMFGGGRQLPGMYQAPGGGMSQWGQYGGMPYGGGQAPIMAPYQYAGGGAYGGAPYSGIFTGGLNLGGLGGGFNVGGGVYGGYAGGYAGGGIVGGGIFGRGPAPITAPYQYTGTQVGGIGVPIYNGGIQPVPRGPAPAVLPLAPY